MKILMSIMSSGALSIACFAKLLIAQPAASSAECTKRSELSLRRCLRRAIRIRRRARAANPLYGYTIRETMRFPTRPTIRREIH